MEPGEISNVLGGWLHAAFGHYEDGISWWQMCARAGVLFVYGIALLRLAGTRIFGKSAPLDIIMSVIIGSNLSRTLTGNAPIVEVMIATAFLLALHWALAQVAHRYRWFSNMVKGKPHELVRDGTIDWAAMRHEGLGMRDLETAMRDGGVVDVAEIQRATLERDGSISIMAD